MGNAVMDNVLAFASILGVFILALVQLVKTTISLPKNLLPLIGFVIGLIVGAAAYPFTDLTIDLRLWAGGLAGLTATGLFELAFNYRGGSTKDP